MKKQLLGVNITIDNKETILTEVRNYLLGKSKKFPFVIVTPNPEQIMLAQRDKEFLKLLNKVDVSLPDGIGIVWAMKGIVSRIPGIDFMQDLVRMANKNNWTIGFVGGWNGVGKKALVVLQSSYVNLHGWAITPEETDEQKLAKHIVDSNTRIVFVGLGAPKQEEYIDILKKQCKKVVFMAVGGSFDMIAGVTPRAPDWIQKIGLEWLYRLFREPWRWKRQLAIWSFIVRVVLERF
ncbi:MAG: teichoic acid biosynthesis protein, N-acetylglucosaminyldiphosphoundecaprenol [Microgenomates group bacterium GW2011_GWC1_39_12]|nr:MAG: teichoic acid biosynthesis protein, N-acetylglucosaminyldiphosphoundecaprenol [Microgenomates group bacterium GW2011_GWC1_39_12]